MHAIAKEHLVIEKIHSREHRREGATPRRRGRRQRRRRGALTSTVLLATSATLVLAACGGTAALSSGNSSSGVVNLTWQTLSSGNTLTPLSQMVHAFNASHPGIHVTEANIPSSTGD